MSTQPYLPLGRRYPGPPTLRRFRVELCPTKDRYRVYLGKPHPYSDKSGWCWLNRFLAQAHLGRPLATDEQVDHSDGNRHNDRIENLVVWLMTDGWNRHFWRSEMALVAEWVGPGTGTGNGGNGDRGAGSTDAGHFYEYVEPVDVSELKIPF